MFPREYPDTIETAVQTGVHDHAYARGRKSAKSKCFKELCPKKYAMTLCIAAALGGVFGTCFVKASTMLGIQAESPIAHVNQIKTEALPLTQSETMPFTKGVHTPGNDPVADAVEIAKAVAKQPSGDSAAVPKKGQNDQPDVLSLLKSTAEKQDDFPGMATQTSRLKTDAEVKQASISKEAQDIPPPLPSGLAFFETPADSLSPVARNRIRIGASDDLRCNLDHDAIKMGAALIQQGIGAWDKKCGDQAAELTEQIQP